MAQMKIGTRDLDVPEFSGYKGFYVGEIVSRLGDSLPKWQLEMAEFRTRFGETNKLRVLKDSAAAERLGIGASSFTEKGYVDVPGSPSAIEEIVSVLPQAFPVAREEITRMLALVVIPNRELEELDEAGTTDEELLKRGRRLLHEGSLEQIAELIAYGVGEIRGKLGGLAGTVFGSWSPDSQESSPEETSGDTSPSQSETGDTRRTELKVAEIEKPQSSEKSTSSTDSPAGTDGQGRSPSTASVGAPSSS